MHGGVGMARMAGKVQGLTKLRHAVCGPQAGIEASARAIQYTVSKKTDSQEVHFCL